MAMPKLPFDEMMLACEGNAGSMVYAARNSDRCVECGRACEYNDLRVGYCGDCFGFDKLANDKAEGGKDWANWAKIGEAVKATDFGCQFDCNGTCACTRYKHEQWSGEKACCTGCAHNVGYLYHIPTDAVELVSELWDDKDGFWRPGGCILPHEYRSRTCLEYGCGNRERREHADTDGIDDIRDLVNTAFVKG